MNVEVHCVKDHTCTGYHATLVHQTFSAICKRRRGIAHNNMKNQKAQAIAPSPSVLPWIPHQGFEHCRKIGALFPLHTPPGHIGESSDAITRSQKDYISDFLDSSYLPKQHAQKLPKHSTSSFPHHLLAAFHRDCEDAEVVAST